MCIQQRAGRCLFVLFVVIWITGITGEHTFSRPADESGGQTVEINLGGPRDVKTTVHDSKNEYSVNVSFLPVNVFDEAKNQKLNRIKAEQYSQKALTRYLDKMDDGDASEGGRKVEFSYSGAAIQTLKNEDDLYSARIVIPKSGFKIIRLVEQAGPASKSEPTLKNEPAAKNEPASTRKPAPKEFDLIDRKSDSMPDAELKLEDRANEIREKSLGEMNIQSAEKTALDRLNILNEELRDKATARLDSYTTKTEPPDVDLDSYTRGIRDDIDNDINSFLEELENEKLIMKEVLSDYQEKLKDHREEINELIEEKSKEIRHTLVETR